MLNESQQKPKPRRQHSTHKKKTGRNKRCPNRNAKRVAAKTETDVATRIRLDETNDVQIEIEIGKEKKKKNPLLRGVHVRTVCIYTYAIEATTPRLQIVSFELFFQSHTVFFQHTRHGIPCMYVYGINGIYVVLRGRT